MHVYFVRHGVTDLNRKHKHQSPSTPLLEEGRAQARTRAEALRPMNPDILLCSPYTRALETARIIGNHVGLVPEPYDFFREIERPASLYGHSHFAFRTYWYALMTIVHKNSKAWRYQDAENFVDISERAKSSLTFIESLRETHNSVVIVSHAAFINIMVSYMCKNKLLGFWDTMLTFFHIKRMKNTGVICVEYIGDGNRNTCNWRVVSS